MPDEPGVREYYVKAKILRSLSGSIIAIRKPPLFPFGYTFVLELKRYADVGLSAQPIRGVDVFEEVANTRYNLNTPTGISYWHAELNRRRENSELHDLMDAKDWAADAVRPKSHFDWKSTGFALPEIPAVSERAAKLAQLVTTYLDEYGL